MTELDLDALEAVVETEDSLSAEYMQAFDLPTMRQLLAAVRAGEALRVVAGRIGNHELFCAAGALRVLRGSAEPCDCDLSTLAEAIATYDRATRCLTGGENG